MEFTFEILTFLFFVAFAAGFIDSLAGGGGLISIPALIAVGIPPVNAIATSKLQSVIGTAGAVFAFARKGYIDFRRYSWLAIGAFLSGAFGSFLVQLIDPSFLAAFVPVLLILIAVYFLFAPKMSEEDKQSRIGIIGLSLVIALIGIYDGFFAPGSGSFMTTALIALGGFGIVKATAHTKFFNFSSSLASLIVFIVGGKMLWIAGGLMASGNILGNQLGTHTAMRFGGRAVRPVLVVISIAMTIKLLSDPSNPLRKLLFP